jgi:hypothetical protein
MPHEHYAAQPDAAGLGDMFLPGAAYAAQPEPERARRACARTACTHDNWLIGGSDRHCRSLPKVFPPTTQCVKAPQHG